MSKLKSKEKRLILFTIGYLTARHELNYSKKKAISLAAKLEVDFNKLFGHLKQKP